MIRFENVSKIYPKQDRAALDSVNIDIQKGEFVFLVDSLVLENLLFCDWF